MFSLDHKLASLTCVAKRPMGQIKSPSSISPHPMCSQNSFHPFLHPSSLTDSTAKPHLSKPSQPSLLHPTSQTSTSYLPYYILPPKLLLHTPALSILANPTQAILLSTMSSVLTCLPLTASSHGIHLSVLVIMPPLPKDSLLPLLNLCLWPSKVLWPPTPNQLMVLARYTSHNSVTSGESPKRLACRLITLCYAPLLVNSKAFSLVTPFSHGFLACAAGILSIMHHGMVTMTGYTLPGPLQTKKALNTNSHQGLLFLLNTSPASTAPSISHLLSMLLCGL